MTPDTLLTLAVATLLLPLCGFVLMIFFGKRLPRQGDWLSTSVIAVSLGMAVAVLAAKIGSYGGETLTLNFTWVDLHNVPLIGALPIVLGVAVDNLTAVMLVVVTLISTLVHLFSIGYMHGDIRYSRYFAYLGFFSFSMLMIVLANNLFLLYVGWELVGISSYLLIGHWYEKKSASNAAIKAFLVNRVGDFGFFLGIAMLFMTFHTFGLREIFEGIGAGRLPFESNWWLTAAGVLLFCGAVGKSAQFPLHVWLPDAMEGPTPVSALIHAATMVAAGVYLVARIFPLMTADALLVVAYIGAITAFISATIAITQNDIKKVLAYSTISQLGYMIMGLGVGAYSAGFFHLVTHAMFKAGLFLGSGSIIHAMHNALHHENDHATDAQDLRNMGGIRKAMPVTFWTFVVYTLAICGVPLTSGFLSKDEILAGTLAFGGMSGHVIIPVIGFLVAGLTAFYMFRVVILAFLGDHKDAARFSHLRESPMVMTIPLVVLAILSIFVFYSFNPFGASDSWIVRAVGRPDSVVPPSMAAPSTEAFEEAAHGLHGTAMLLSLSVAGIGVLFAFVTYYWRKINADAAASALGPVYRFLLNKWYFDEIYQAVIVNGTLALSRILRWFDGNIVDGLVNGTGWVTRGISSVSGMFDTYVVDGIVNLTGYLSGVGGLALRKFQTGRVQSYVIFAVLSVMVFYFVFRLV